MEEWIWPDQLSLKIMLIAVFCFTMLSLFFVVLTLMIRGYHNLANKRLQKITDDFTELFFDYLDNPEDQEVFHKLNIIKDKEAFFRFLLHYMQILKGRSNEIILDLMIRIDFTHLLQTNLKNSKRWKRAYAAYALGILQDKNVIPDLLQASNDTFYLVRFYATTGIIKMRHPEYLKAAINNLFQIPHLSYYQVMEGLVEVHRDDISLCLEIIHETDHSDQRQLKIFVDLFSFKKYAEAAEDIFKIYTIAEDRELKISCVRALGLLHHTPAVPILRRFLEEDDWVIKSQVMRALGRIGDIGSLADFLDELKAENFWIRYNAALALFDLGSVGQEYLKKTCEDMEHPGQEMAEQILFEKRVFVNTPGAEG